MLLKFIIIIIIIKIGIQSNPVNPLHLRSKFEFTFVAPIYFLQK